MMKRVNKRFIYLLGLLLCGCISALAQEQKKATFVPPFDFSLTFSGNFGELRSNHFHGGLDFKTGGVVGKPVRALADGYLSRIRVTNGSGCVLEVTYHNGYTTINRHLDAFMPAVEKRVRDLQYEQESWEVEIVPSPDEYPVKAGEQIAWSGNTGYSFGPHLHLDMFETESGDYIDPLPFFQRKVKDTRAPSVRQLMLFPQLGRGVVNRSQQPHAFAPSSSERLEAWGVIGAGLKAYDYMDGVSNHYGVYYVSLSVDSVEVFRSVVDRFSSEENLLINSWTYQGSYMKSFIEPGNTLRMLQAFNEQRGLVTIDEERPYRFVYTLKDVFGNTSQARFVVHGKKQDVEPVDRTSQYFLDWQRTHTVQEPGMDLLVPRGALYDDVFLHAKVAVDSADIAFTYRLHDTPVPLHFGCPLRISLWKQPVADGSKYYVAKVGRNGRSSYVGGTYDDGSLKVNIRQLATYTVKLDTVPPEITPLQKAQWAKKRKVTVRLKDRETGVRTYRGAIDGRFALFGRRNLVQSVWECELDPCYLPKGGKHVLELWATDACGNESYFRDTFVW